MEEDVTSSCSNADIISIVDSSRKEIISYRGAKSYSSLIVASPDLKKGETYTIKVNESSYQSFIISNISTNVGERNGGNAQQGGHSGRR